MNRKDLIELRSKLQQDIAAIDRVLSIIPPQANGVKTKAQTQPVVSNGTINHLQSQTTATAFLENSAIRSVILEKEGRFTTSQITEAVNTKFPNKPVRPAQIPSVVFRLKKTNLITEFPSRDGKKEYEVVYK